MHYLETPIQEFTFDFDGFTVQCKVLPDDCSLGYPWVEHDGHGYVRQEKWDRGGKCPGEIELYNRGSCTWYYDFQRTIGKAKADGWGFGGDKTGLTRGEIAVKAVQNDMQYCKEWLQGDRSWVTIEAQAFDTKGEALGLPDYISGVEWACDSETQKYLKDTAKDAAENAARGVKKEKKEKEYWANRGMITA